MSLNQPLSPEATALARIVDKISFGWPLKALQPEIRVTETRFDVSLIISLRTPHRETGRMGPFAQTLSFAPAMLSELGAKTLQKVVLERLHFALRAAACHEVDESFMVDGQRIFDPHKEESDAAQGRTP